MPVRADQVHHVAGHEVAADRRGCPRPAASGAARPPRPPRRRPARAAPRHVGGVPQPEPAGRQPPPGRPERGADLRPAAPTLQRRGHVRRPRPAAPGCPTPRPSPAAVILVAMPPVPRLSAPARATRTASRSVGCVDVGQQPRPRPARVAVVETVHVGQQHQRVGADQVRHQRGQPVVVADPDLVGGHRVVLVHHRQHAQPEQPLQGALGVAVVRAADHVVRGEQHLADGLAVPGERRHRRPAPAAAARRGGGLLGGQVAGASGQPQRGQPGRDGARGHQHHLAAGRPARGQRVDQRVQPRRVQAAGSGWSARTSRP